MDAETEKKLTGQQHQIEMLGTKMEANMKTMKAENESALSKNEAAIAGLRTDIEKALGEFRTTTEKKSRVLLLEIAGVVGGVVAIISLIVGLIFSQ
ncbi:MAG: hypothetical protein OXF29_00655 [Hyphomicrobiales bacterium]|nr:hypothetical protein [Hyphomicrobiales bacterium]